MARLGIKNLPHPGTAHSVVRVPAPAPGRDGKARYKLETHAEALEEDLKRARLCERASSPLFTTASATDLAERLSGGVTPRTLASSRYMRRHRIRIGGGVWRLLDDGPWDVTAGDQVAVLTLVPRCWELTPKELEETRAERLMGQLRTWLIRAGVNEASGFLIACLHGEFEPTSGVFRVHVHGVVAGGMVSVVDAMRSHPELDHHRDPPGGLDGSDAIGTPASCLSTAPTCTPASTCCTRRRPQRWRRRNTRETTSPPTSASFAGS